VSKRAGPTEAEMRARFSDGGSLFLHAPCFTPWFTETQTCDAVAIVNAAGHAEAMSWHPQSTDRPICADLDLRG
jgi:hypothetical protein